MQLQHRKTLETRLVAWGCTRFTLMPSTGDVILWGKTSNTDSPKLHVYNSSATSWKKEQTIPELCKHPDITSILPITIEGQEFLAIACIYCNRIRLCNMNTGEITTAFHDPRYYPGRMCHGDTGQIYVVHNVKGGFPILQLDCSHPQFSLIKTIQSGMKKYYAICYIPTHRLIAISSNEDPKMVQAVSCDTEKVMWQLIGSVDGVECHPHGMMYSPQHDTLLITDGINCRVLVLNSHDGSVRQVISLSDDMCVTELCLYEKQVVMQHNVDNKEKVSYFSIE